jgi:putative membrane protein
VVEGMAPSSTIGRGTAVETVDGAGSPSIVATVGSAEEAVPLVEEEQVAIGKAIKLTERDRARISEAVRAAERQTSAEIVPMIVGRSGLYRDAQYRCGLGLALVVLTGLLMWESVWLPWGWHAANAILLLVATVVAYGVGAGLGTIAPVIRAVTSTERLRHKVRLRAERAFAQHAIARTSERTGVLLMVSLLERQVYLLPDRGIASLITAAQWEAVVAAVVSRLKAHDIAGGLCAGIEQCGVLLAQVCPAEAAGNPNELPDRLVQEP